MNNEERDKELLLVRDALGDMKTQIALVAQITASTREILADPMNGLMVRVQKIETSTELQGNEIAVLKAKVEGDDNISRRQGNHKENLLVGSRGNMIAILAIAIGLLIAIMK